MSKEKKVNVTRRLFLKLGLWGTGIASTWGIWKFLNYEPPVEKLLPSIILGKPNTYPIGSITFIPEVKAYLVHDRNGIFAVSAVCTHLGCTIGEGDEKFVCPCHGSEFGFNSRVLQGPATKSLSNLDVSLTDNGFLRVDRMTEVPATQRIDPRG